MAFDTHVSECAAVVVDPNSERFGEVADITMHDWKEYGKVFVQFADGTSGNFEDGMMSTDTQLPGVVITRKDEKDRIAGLQEGLPDIQDALREQVSINEKRINPEEARMAAKTAFKAMLSDLQPPVELEIETEPTDEFDPLD